jgi:hypothetical protein
MISTEAAGLVLSIAQGVVKLGGKIDRLMAEKDAVTSDYIIPMPQVRRGPGGVEKKNELKALLQNTEDQIPDPLSPNRDEIKDLLLQDPSDPAQVGKWYKQFFPEKDIQPIIEPDTEFVKALQSAFPSMDLEDESTRYAAFCISAGRDEREIGYPFRAAMVVVDVLAEFGAENTTLFVHDDNVRPIVQSVLKRFSNPDLDTFTSWSPLLRSALSATLNGVLDSKESWQGENQWVNAVLNALATAREEAGDDYLLGLFQGKGYRLLISEGLSEAASLLDDEDAGHFEQIAGDILKQAAPLVQANQHNFREFFQEHWGDLFRAGLGSLEKHGPDILKDDSPLLRVTLMAMIKELSNTPNTDLISHETLYNLADSAISAVAVNPDLVTPDVDSPWMKTLIGSVIKTAADQGVRKLFSKKSFESMVNDSLKVFSDHSELLVKKPGLLQELTGNILKQVSAIESFGTEAVATAAVEGALNAVAENPKLLDTNYAELVSGFAGKLARLVADKSLTKIQASDIAAAGAEAVLLNPDIFIKYENKLTEAVVDAVLEAAEDNDANLLYGATLVDLVLQLIDTVSCYGLAMVDGGPVDALMGKLKEVLTAGLTKAEAELGRQLDLPALPAVLSGLVAATARGELSEIDPNDQKFKDLFSDLALRAVA